jgi:hypothetical protein
MCEKLEGPGHQSKGVGVRHHRGLDADLSEEQAHGGNESGLGCGRAEDAL